MAKSSSFTRLPSPEEYGRKLAQRRQKAWAEFSDSLVARMSAELERYGARIMERLDDEPNGLEQLEAVVNQIFEMLKGQARTLTGIRPAPDLSEITREIQRSAEYVRTSLAHSVKAIEMPQPERVDLAPLDKKLDALLERKPEDIPQPQTEIVDMQVTSRDDKGDIKTVTAQIVPK